MAVTLGPFSLTRMVRAVEKVRERLLRATKLRKKPEFATRLLAEMQLPPG